MLIGTIIDLLKLTFNPVAKVKVFRIPLRDSSCVTQPSIIMRVSSAYWTTGKKYQNKVLAAGGDLVKRLC
jgi:hypothetical protein